MQLLSQILDPDLNRLKGITVGVMKVHPAGTHTKYPYLCTGVLRCGKCGRKLCGRVSRGRKADHKSQVYYLCLGRSSKGGGECDLPYFRVEEIDRAVWSLILRLLKDEKFLDESIAAGEESKPEVTADDLKRVEQAITRTTEGENRVISLWRQGKITNAQLDIQKEECRAEQEELLSKKIRIEASLRSQDDKDRLAAVAKARIEQLRGLIDNFSFEDRREILRAIAIGDKTNHIELSPDGKLTVKGVLDLREPDGSAVGRDRGLRVRMGGYPQTYVSSWW